jgi:hypothetical protein
MRKFGGFLILLLLSTSKPHDQWPTENEICAGHRQAM